MVSHDTRFIEAFDRKYTSEIDYGNNKYRIRTHGFGISVIDNPYLFLYRYRTGLVKDTLIAALRMTVQLFLIGFYLEYLFLWDKLWINLLWILLMIIIASSTALKRTHLPVRTLFMTVSVAFLVSLLIIDFYFLGLVVRPEKSLPPDISFPSAV